jgi:hypothetical protein
MIRIEAKVVRAVSRAIGATASPALRAASAGTLRVGCQPGCWGRSGMPFRSIVGRCGSRRSLGGGSGSGHSARYAPASAAPCAISSASVCWTRVFS